MRFSSIISIPCQKLITYVPNLQTVLTTDYFISCIEQRRICSYRTTKCIKLNAFTYLR